MKISIVICSYGGNESLTKSCIESLNLQSSLPYEIIVVLDTREEQENFNRYLCKVTTLPCNIAYTGKKGLAAARNKGIEMSNGDIIAFIDDDAIADSQWIYEIQKTFSTSKMAGVVGGPVSPIFEGNSIDEKFYWVIGCTGTTPPPSRPIGCNMAFRREIFNKIGSFNEDLGRVRKKLAVGEETDLFLRISTLIPEFLIIFNEKAKVFHKTPDHRLTIRYFLKRSYEEGYSKSRISKIYKLKEERKFLSYYIHHPDIRTLFVVTATGMGYLMGLIHGIWSDSNKGLTYVF
jgi:glycosyltransferase involved in cell wall biosynthesis